MIISRPGIPLKSPDLSNRIICLANNLLSVNEKIIGQIVRIVKISNKMLTGCLRATKCCHICTTKRVVVKYEKYGALSTNDLQLTEFLCLTASIYLCTVFDHFCSNLQTGIFFRTLSELACKYLRQFSVQDHFEFSTFFPPPFRWWKLSRHFRRILRKVADIFGQFRRKFLTQILRWEEELRRKLALQQCDVENQVLYPCSNKNNLFMQLLCILTSFEGAASTRKQFETIVLAIFSNFFLFWPFSSFSIIFSKKKKI